jgi:hypothetical protein
MLNSARKSVEPRVPRRPSARDYEQLAAELIRAWRGQRSLAAFSRRLGSSGGMVHNWEAKRRWPTAARALECAERVGVDVGAALAKFYGRKPKWYPATKPSSPEGVVHFLNDWVGQTPVTVIATKVGSSRHAVGRWLRGAAEPRLPDFLRLVDTCSLRLLDYLACLVDVRLMPSLALEWTQLQAARALAYEAPWTHAVLRALELTNYTELPRHDDALVGSLLGITEGQVRICIQLLEHAGEVTFDGKLYRSSGAAAVDTRSDARANMRLKAWWSQVTNERMTAGSQGQFSFNLFSVSRHDFERIRELQVRYFRELRQIVADSSPNETVAVVNMQLLDLRTPRDE